MKKVKWKLLLAVGALALQVGATAMAAGASNGEEPDYILGRPMTQAEIEEQRSYVPENLGGAQPGPMTLPKGNELYNAGEATVYDAAFDLRDKSQVSSVKNQDSWGTCWAFSLMGAAESNLLGKGIGGQDLSELQLAYFTYNKPNDPLGGTAGDNVKLNTGMDFLMSGGNPALASTLMMGWLGMTDEAVVPYSKAKEDIEDRTLDSSYAYKKNSMILETVRWIEPSDRQLIKKYLINNGAGTIFYRHDDAYYNAENGAYYTSDPYSGSGHLVTIVGWDDNYSRNNFGSKKPQSNGAWLIKNSWGENWGNNGYFWLSYEDATIQDYCCFLDVEKASKYQHNYQYDGTGGYVTWGGSSTSVKSANIFQAKGLETLKAVSVANAAKGTSCEIQVYTNVDAGRKDPTKGTPVFDKPVTAYFDTYGYFTVELPHSVLLEKDSLFSVVVTMKNADRAYCMVARDDDSWNWAIMNNTARYGESFAFYEGKWEDFASIGANVRIKALTKDFNANLSSIKVTKKPTKVQYYDGDTFKSAGIRVQATFSDNTIADVTEDCTFTGTTLSMLNKTVTISYTYKGVKKTTTLPVTVLERKASKVRLNYSSLKITKGKRFYWLKPTVYPATTTNKNVTWSSSRRKIASVNSAGVIRARRLGTTIITVKTANGKKDTLRVEVVKTPIKVVKVKLPKTLKMKKGTLKQLTPIVYPIHAANKSVSWKTSKKRIATVNSDGVVKARRTGIVKITATSRDGSKKYSTCTITVTK